MILKNYLPETFTAKKYVKVNGVAQYQNSNIPVDDSIIEKCEAIILLIRSYQYWKTNPYVNIHSDQFIHHIGNSYKAVVKLLVEFNLIRTSKSFKVGNHSTPYCIHEEYFNQINAHYNYRLYDGNQLLNRKGCMTVDHSSNQDILLKKDIPMGISYCHTTPTVIQPKSGSTLLNYIANTLSIIHQRNTLIQPKVKVSSKCGRIFTPITSMKKADRLTILPDHTTIDFKTSHLQHLIKLIDSTGTTTIDHQEYNRFKLAVLEGDFYNSLNNRYTRKQNKKYACCWLATSRGNWNGVKSLKALFPTITAFSEDFNGGTRNKLLNELMRSESILINSTIIHHIAEHSPELAVYGIHDAVMFSSEHKQMMVELIECKGKEYFGFRPRFTINEPTEQIQPAAPIVAPEPVLVEAIIEPKPKNIMKDKFSPSHTLQQMVDVYGNRSKNVIEFAAKNGLSIPRPNNGYGDFPNPGKINGESALKLTVQRWDDIDEVIDRIGEAVLL